MTRSSLTKHKKIAAGILGMLLLFVVLFSSFYIAVEAHHDCTGEDCPVCASIQQYANAIRQIGGGIAHEMEVILPALIILITTALFAFVFQQETLVSRKIRMND